MIQIHNIVKKGFHERFHVDSNGRRWNFVQRERLHPRWRYSHIWNQGKIFWVCTSCEGVEIVKFTSFIHDEVTVPDPTEQLDPHDCDIERVRQIMEA